MNSKPLFTLLRAGLWEQEARLAPYGDIDFHALYHLANSQTVIGLVAEGLNRVSDTQIPPDVIVPFAADAIQTEQRNRHMNRFIRQLFSVFRNNGVQALLIRGQGIAQCYPKPLIRVLGDIDILLPPDQYQRAKRNLASRASSLIEENPRRLHTALSFPPFTVELHGTLASPALSKRINKEITKIQNSLFPLHCGRLLSLSKHDPQPHLKPETWNLQPSSPRLWLNDGTPIPLPPPDDDAILVFTHLLGHFFTTGVGLRQICDWTRLLYTHHSHLDIPLLHHRLAHMHLLSEWKTFAAFAVNTLGAPPDTIPLYSPAKKWQRKAKRLQSLILLYGNFGHNRDRSYISSAPFLRKKALSLRWITLTTLRQLPIFPVDTILFSLNQITQATTKALRRIR